MNRADLIMAEFDRMDAARGALRVAVLSGQEELTKAKELQTSFTATLLENAPKCWDEISPYSPEVRACRYLRHLESAVSSQGRIAGVNLHRMDCAGDCPARECEHIHAPEGAVKCPTCDADLS